MKLIFPLLTLAVMLSGCTMAPSFTRPDAPVADTWEQTSATTNQPTMLVAHIGWHDFFRDDELQRIIGIALENNRDLRIAALNIEAARALYRIQRADLVPSVNAVGATTFQRTPESLSTTGSAETSEVYQANLSATAYELDLFGRVRSLNRAALERWLATHEARTAVQIALIAEVANAYLQWQADSAALRLAEETLQAQQKSYDLIAKSHENGVVSGLDVAQVSQAVAAARATRERFTRFVEQDRNALTLLMGIANAKDYLRQAPPLADTDLLPTLPIGLPSDVLLARPDVRQAEHTLKEMNANIGAARAAFFPRISLTGSFGFASDNLDDLFTGAGAGAWSFGPQVSLPIFSGGRNFANLGFSNAQKEAAVAAYEGTIQTAFREVADELAARKTLNSELAAQRELVAAAQKAYDLSLARYRSGIDSFLNVLDAQRTLFAAQQNEIVLEQQYFANLVNLYKALGGGQQAASTLPAAAAE